MPHRHHRHRRRLLLLLPIAAQRVAKLVVVVVVVVVVEEVVEEVVAAVVVIVVEVVDVSGALRWMPGSLPPPALSHLGGEMLTQSHIIRIQTFRRELHSCDTTSTI